MKTIGKDTIIGYAAGVTTGVTYGLNPLFAVPLMKAGASVEAILFFRYALSMVLLGAFIMLSKRKLRVSVRQAGILLVIGLLYTASSALLFEAYRFVASGLATTLVFLYPVLVAIIMVFLKVMPTWQVWMAILATFAGVVVMTHSCDSQMIEPVGVLLSIGSALAYAFVIVLINRSKPIHNISNSVLTFYVLVTGSIMFMGKLMCNETSWATGLEGDTVWLNLLGLAILPTIVSTSTLAIATRKIGATKASVLGVFEPITAILVGAIAFGEIITPNIIVGITLAMAAVTFMVLSAKT